MHFYPTPRRSSFPWLRHQGQTPPAGVLLLLVKPNQRFCLGSLPRPANQSPTVHLSTKGQKLRTWTIPTVSGQPGGQQGTQGLWPGTTLIPALAVSQCQPVHSTEKHTLAACPGVFPEEKFNLIYIFLSTLITKRWPLKKVKRSISSRYLAGPGLQNKKIHVPYSLHKTRFLKK